jgi:hypothetical protein
VEHVTPARARLPARTGAPAPVLAERKTQLRRSPTAPHLDKGKYTTSTPIVNVGPRKFTKLVEADHDQEGEHDRSASRLRQRGANTEPYRGPPTRDVTHVFGLRC